MMICCFEEVFLEKCEWNEDVEGKNEEADLVSYISLCLAVSSNGKQAISKRIDRDGVWEV